MLTPPSQRSVEFDGKCYRGLYSVSGRLMIARIPGIGARSRETDDPTAALADTLLTEILAEAKASGRLASR